MFECKCCGGRVEPQKEDKNIGKCESCGLLMNLPTEKNERIVNRYNKANRYRINKEFERAIGVYESILDDDSKESDAYFGILLCTYGIEYVIDPKSKDEVITCHKVNSKNIYEDINYKKALEYSVGSKKNHYETEAKKIDEILREIIVISKKEKPYDAFICYKETEISNERRTEDSIRAQDLYEELTRSGLRVFFARISLEKVVGENYEPYIYGALNTSKAMIVIGSDKNFFESEWMRNEWSRYLKIIDKEPTKILIPVYYDMSPKDLPLEFSKKQAMDMNSITFTQDIIHIVKKIVENNLHEEKKDKRENFDRASRLVSRGFDLLEEGNIEKAKNIFTRALDEDNECSDAYLGLIFADLNTYDIKYFANKGTEIGQAFFEEALKLNDSDPVDRETCKKIIIDSFEINYERYHKYANEKDLIAFDEAFELLVDNAYERYSTKMSEKIKNEKEIESKKQEDELIKREALLKEYKIVKRVKIIALLYLALLAVACIFIPKLLSTIINAYSSYKSPLSLIQLFLIMFPLLLITTVIIRLFYIGDGWEDIFVHVPSSIISILFLLSPIAMWADGYKLGHVVITILYISLIVGVFFGTLFINRMLSEILESISNNILRLSISIVIIVVLLVLPVIINVPIKNYRNATINILYYYSQENSDAIEYNYELARGSMSSRTFDHNDSTSIKDNKRNININDINKIEKLLTIEELEKYEYSISECDTDSYTHIIIDYKDGMTYDYYYCNKENIVELDEKIVSYFKDSFND